MSTEATILSHPRLHRLGWKDYSVAGAACQGNRASPAPRRSMLRLYIVSPAFPALSLTLTLMVYPIQQCFSRLLTLGRFLLVLLLFQATVLTPPAVAVLRQHQDAPGIMRYHSQESLKDESGRTWQVVLFKKIIPGQSTRLNLRLVGFPGIAEFTHPQLLEIATAGGKLLTAPDVFAQEAPAPNVGQYDVTDVFAQLQADESLTLSIPLKQGQPLSLTIPQSLVIEWQLLVTEIL